MQFLIVAGLRAGALDNGPPANFEQLIEEEKAHARQAYVQGSIRQIWLQTPGPGAVAIVEADTPEDAERVFAEFPLAEAGLLDGKVIGLAPYAGFGEVK
ncbi:muconolactone Delta-isomerase family protein [Rhizobium sp. ICMP 5592]|uniref:muconolactone Delta-isomerase family protein n=1 Tax=Rhizobium sp. ICMP 5592 TaxID=2292445 RepID=UPI0012955650|nr:muconolactone Delta-isomerase family protein [Rhizobium sp. ICMP 5592]MQB46140.1 hypothetical protein [Rhizobium sp. ICMP 5592]